MPHRAIYRVIYDDVTLSDTPTSLGYGGSMKILFILTTVFSVSCMGIEHFTLEGNKKLNLPFSDAVKVGKQIYISGNIGVLPGTATLVEGGIEAETEQTLKNIGRVLEHYGLNFSDIYRCQIMLAEISEWKTMNSVYKRYFKAPYPARSALGAKGLALGARVEIECTASAHKNAEY